MKWLMLYESYKQKLFEEKAAKRITQTFIIRSNCTMKTTQTFFLYKKYEKKILLNEEEGEVMTFVTCCLLLLFF